MRVAVTAAIFCVAACVTYTEPTPMGNDTYFLGTNARGGFSSNSQLLADTIQRANAFCAGMNRTAVVSEANARGAQGWTPQDTRVVFRCAENAPATSN
jgi:hypothetical protein